MNESKQPAGQFSTIALMEDERNAQAPRFTDKSVAQASEEPEQA